MIFGYVGANFVRSDERTRRAAPPLSPRLTTQARRVLKNRGWLDTLGRCERGNIMHELFHALTIGLKTYGVNQGKGFLFRLPRTSTTASYRHG